MFVFLVTFRCKPDKREAFYEAILTEGIDAAARAEAGNLQYDFYFPTGSASDLLLIEKYRDADALAEHVRQAHTARLVELKEIYVNDMTIEKYEDQR